MVDLSSWPQGIRLIVRAQRDHTGAQLPITDAHGNRLTCFATNTLTGQLADLELRHRHRTRAKDRIRCAKDTGMANLPLHGWPPTRSGGNWYCSHSTYRRGCSYRHWPRGPSGGGSPKGFVSVCWPPSPGWCVPSAESDRSERARGPISGHGAPGKPAAFSNVDGCHGAEASVCTGMSRMAARAARASAAWAVAGKASRFQWKIT